MKIYNKHIVAFDSLRFIFCIFVILHHIGINIYSFHGLPNPYFLTAHLAVECFFVLSGFLLAKHFFSVKITDSNAGEEVGRFFLKRLKRLYPEYLFALIVCFVLTNVFAHHITSKTFFLNLSLLTGWGNIPNIINGIWYVIVLFWGGAFLYFLLCFWGDKARFVFLPTLAIICLFYLVNHGGSIGGHQLPIEFNLLSKGTIRGILGLCVGIFCFEICHFLSGLKLNFNMQIINPLLHVAEFLSVFLLIRLCLFKKSDGIYDFNVYYYASFIIGLCYFKKELLLKCLSRPFWKHFSYLAYSIYLTHLIPIEIMREHWKGLSYMSPYISYPIILACSIGFGFLCYHSQKYLFAKVKFLLIKA